LIVALPRAPDGFASRSFEQARREPAFGERALRGLDDPVARELSAREQRERQRSDTHVGAHGQAEAQPHARANACAAERACIAAERHPRRDGDEGRGVALVELREDAPAQVASLGPHRQRARELVEGDGGRLRRQERHVLEQPVGQRAFDAAKQRLRGEPVERRRSLGPSGQRERSEALPKHGPPGPSIVRGQVQQSLEVVAAGHDRSG
jgi:hypothetical protein